MKKLFLVLLPLLLLSCEKEIKKPSEDTLLARQAFALAEGMRDAYVRKNFRAFRKYCTELGYEAVLKGIKKFSRVEIEFTPRWVDIEEDGTVYMNISWKGSWTMLNRVEDLSGMAVFKLAGKPPRVEDIVRGNPFEQPAVAPADTGAPR
jgi:hypothetical protein